MPVSKKLIEDTLNNKKRKRGETAKKIFEILQKEPGISCSDIAILVDRKLCTVKSHVRKLYSEDEQTKAKLVAATDINFSELELLKIIRKGALKAKFGKVKIKKIKKSKKIRWKWRGKANWPAKKVATKYSSERDLLNLV